MKVDYLVHYVVTHREATKVVRFTRGERSFTQGVPDATYSLMLTLSACGRQRQGKKSIRVNVLPICSVPVRLLLPPSMHISNIDLGTPETPSFIQIVTT